MDGRFNHVHFNLYCSDGFQAAKSFPRASGSGGVCINGLSFLLNPDFKRADRSKINKVNTLLFAVCKFD